jgi:hypothetical protein
VNLQSALFASLGSLPGGKKRGLISYTIFADRENAGIANNPSAPETGRVIVIPFPAVFLWRR